MITNIIAKGHILIAKPGLYDLEFDRSVILLLDYQKEEGAIGLIQNKKTNVRVDELLPKLQCDFPVYKGGPVEQDNMYYIHSRPDLIKDGLIISPGVYWGGSFRDVKNAINNHLIKPDEIRFYLGYSGWSKNQLEKELSEELWLLAHDNYDFFKSETRSLSIWQQMIRHLGGNYLLWINSPADPAMN